MDIEYLTTEQVANLKGVHYGTVCRVIREGELPAKRFGHAWMVLKKDAEAWTPKSQSIPVSKDDLHRMYIIEEMSITEISNEIGVGRMTIHRHLIKYDIPRRPPGTAHLQGENHPIKNLTGEKRRKWIERNRQSHIGKPQNFSEEELQKRSELRSEQNRKGWEDGTFGNEEWRKKQTESHAGEKCWRWKGGSDHYRGENFQEQRRKARKRDKYTCQRCGVTEIELGQELDVHHIISYSTFEDYTEANELENLICYCKSCHAIIDHATNG